MIDVAHYRVVETMRDGRPVVIRAQRPDDRHGYLAAHPPGEPGDPLPSVLRREALVFRGGGRTISSTSTSSPRSH